MTFSFKTEISSVTRIQNQMSVKKVYLKKCDRKTYKSFALLEIFVCLVVFLLAMSLIAFLGTFWFFVLMLNDMELIPVLAIVSYRWPFLCSLLNTSQFDAYDNFTIARDTQQTIEVMR